MAHHRIIYILDTTLLVVSLSKLFSSVISRGLAILQDDYWCILKLQKIVFNYDTTVYL